MGLLGVLASVFSRKKKTTKEKLEHIDEEIDKIQTLLKRNRQQQRTAVLFLLTVSISLFLLCAGVFYLFYMPTKWTERILYFVPFLLFPLLVIGLKKGLHFVFVTRITKNSQQLEDLKKEKQKILESVMDTETYKVAKEILEKFDPDRKLVEKEKKNEQQNAAPGMELRKRNVNPPTNMSQPASRQMTPRPHGPGGMTPRMVMNGSGPRPNNQYQGTPQFRGPVPMQRPATPAPILPRDRNLVDKVAEYFVGDGPNNRYALICIQCASHNGMALAEEFMFIAYKCCYCGMFNPARKQRLNAPKLEQPKLLRQDLASSTDKKEDGEEEIKESDEESDTQEESGKDGEIKGEELDTEDKKTIEISDEDNKDT